MKNNFGYIYYKEFFEYLNISLKGISEKEEEKKKYYFYPPLTEENNKTDFGKFNDKFLGSKINLSDKIDLLDKKMPSFYLKTTYPGLLSGSGYLHEVGENEDEFQLGFFFDYTTGLPIIPASSIKGVLRYACKMRNGEYLKELVEKIEAENTDFDAKKFVEEVFDGKDKSIYDRDIFFDAFPIKSKGNLFGIDYTTPHNDEPLKNPVPIKFLRVNPDVIYKFQFDLKDSKNGLSAENKMNFFKKIILDLGLGAKTNIGYGQFEALKENELEEERKKEEDLKKQEEERKKAEQRQRNYEKKQAQKQNYPAYKADNIKATAYKKDKQIEVTIIEVSDYIVMEDAEGSRFSKSVANVKKKFEKDLEKKRKKNPNVKFKDLEVGMKIKIHIKSDINVMSNEAIFTVLPVQTS